MTQIQPIQCPHMAMVYQDTTTTRPNVVPSVNLRVPQPSKGKLIVFDGCDGCGKGSMITVMQAVMDTARSPRPEIIYTKHPGATPFGNEMRRVMFETIGTKNIDPNALELLFWAEHIQKVSTVAVPALSRGAWVVSDRWATTSNRAYSQIRNADATLSDFYNAKFAGPHFDTLFLMYGDPIILLERARKRAKETHQAAKAWNTPEDAVAIQKRFFAYLGADGRTIPVPANGPLTAFERFCAYVGPTLLDQNKWLSFDYDAARIKLMAEHPDDEGYLY